MPAGLPAPASVPAAAPAVPKPAAPAPPAVTASPGRSERSADGSGDDAGPGKRLGMISLDLPDGTIDPVPGGVSDHHVTIVFLGSDVDDTEFAQACSRAIAAASLVPGPVTGTVGGLRVFEPSDSSDGKTVAYAPADIPAARPLRDALSGLNASEHPDWIPHVTLAYLDDGDSLPDPVPDTPVTFTHLAVHRGGDVLRFPLSGPRAAPHVNGHRPLASAAS